MLSFVRVVLVIVSLHSHKTVTKTLSNSLPALVDQFPGNQEGSGSMRYPNTTPPRKRKNRDTSAGRHSGERQSPVEISYFCQQEWTWIDSLKSLVKVRTPGDLWVSSQLQKDYEGKKKLSTIRNNRKAYVDVCGCASDRLCKCLCCMLSQRAMLLSVATRNYKEVNVPCCSWLL